MPDRPLAPPTLGRRTAVLGLAATVLVAGCDHGDDIGAPASRAGPSSADASASASAQTPDEALVDDVLGALGAALGTLAAARHQRPLRAPLAPLLRAHRRHVGVLEGESDATASSPVHADAAAALVAVRRSELQLRATLVDAAGRAESGALAKLLASMSASVTQHVAVLPKQVGA